VKLGNQHAGSLRSFSDRGGLARLIGTGLERTGDARATRFGPDSGDRDRSQRRARPLRGRYYDPYAYYRDLLYGGSNEYTPAYDARYPMPPATKKLRTLGRAYDLQGPASYTSIRMHGGDLVRGGYRLQPLGLPTLVVYWPHPVWEGSLFDGRPST
jgi:hypothetical protein